MSDDTKHIEVIENFPVTSIKTGFGNPRKIKKAKAEELQQSLDTLGDFGLILIDEEDNVIAGNQRVQLMKRNNPDATVLVKRLCGYTKAELRAINIKDNTHSGEWDPDILADWTADLNIDLGIKAKEEDFENRKIPDMEPIRYEKYDYVLIVCRNEVDYDSLLCKLNLKGRKVVISPKAQGKPKKSQARAVWYDDIAEQIVECDNVNSNQSEVII